MLYKDVLSMKKNLEVKETNNEYIFCGSLGKSILKKNNNMSLIITNTNLIILTNKKKYNRLYNILIKKIINGVLFGYISRLKLVGIGYYAEIKNSFLFLKLGYSHEIKIKIPLSIEIFIKKRRDLVIMCHDLDLLSDFIYKIRYFRPPECYKGKGILFKNEKIKLKTGKKN